MNSGTNLKLLFIFVLCGLIKAQNTTIDSKIVGGILVPIRSRNFQVSITLPNGYCGGSLLTFKWVLTAAHCLTGIRGRTVKVRAGSNYLNKNGVTATAALIVRHKKFNSRNLKYDIGLIKLERGFKKYANSYSIGVIRLLHKLPPTGSVLTVSGYGALYANGGPYSSPLRAVSLKKISYKKCKRIYRTDLKRTMFCVDAPRKGSCYGDSGGPLVYKGRQAGIVSWSIGCAVYPDVYTSVPRFRGWIWKKIRTL